MKTESEHVQRWEDIIFENRNKAYGAYAIRKSYDDRVLTGWTISLGVIIVIFLSSFFSFEKPAPPIIPVTTCGGFTLPPKIKPTVTAQPTPPAVKHVNRNLPPVATPKEVPDLPADPIEPPTPGGTGDSGIPVEGAAQSGIDVGVSVDPPEAPPYVIVPEVYPMYEGGMEAMMKFLQKKLRYPTSARKLKEEGIVYVSFIINSAGEVTNVEVVKGFYKDCDKEAVRVISMMNKWKPGLQNKMPVAVKMVLPIKFKLES